MNICCVLIGAAKMCSLEMFLEQLMGEKNRRKLECFALGTFS